MKLKSYLKKNKDLIDNFNVLFVHNNKLRCTGLEKTEEDLHRIFDDRNIHRVPVCRRDWDVVLSKEELNYEVVGVPLAHISSLPFHHGTKVLNIVIKKEE